MLVFHTDEELSDRDNINDNYLTREREDKHMKNWLPSQFLPYT